MNTPHPTEDHDESRVPASPVVSFAVWAALGLTVGVPLTVFVSPWLGLIAGVALCMCGPVTVVLKAGG